MTAKTCEKTAKTSGDRLMYASGQHDTFGVRILPAHEVHGPLVGWSRAIWTGSSVHDFVKRQNVR